MIRAAAAAVTALGVALGLAVLPAAAPSPSPSPSPTPTGDPVRNAQYWLDDYGIEDAWKTTKGEGVTIAVIDTGIAKVPQLNDAVIGGTDVSGSGASDGRTPVGVKDPYHGTKVASLAAGREKKKGVGMIGVAPKADLLSISVGIGSAATVPITEQIANAMVWAVDHDADVINLSLTTNTLTWDPSWDNAFQYAFDNDVVVVVAAGNRSNGNATVGAPATIPGVLTVAGVDPDGDISKRASTQGITIGVSAPSEKLVGAAEDGKVVSWSGTSGAAPIVAGVAALVRSAHPDLDANNVINRIVRTTRAPRKNMSLPDPNYGYGLIDAAAAVGSKAVPHVDENPMGSLAEWVRLYRRARPDPDPAPDRSVVGEIPDLPVADAPAQQGSPLLPSRESILTGSIPLIAVTLPGILVVLGVIVAVRRIRSARHSRTPTT